MYVQNDNVLRGHGETQLRSVALDVVEHALAAADPYAAVLRLVRRRGDYLSIGNLDFDLSRTNRVIVIGAGKATLRLAEVLEEILGSRIDAGLIAIKRGQPHSLRHIRVMEASHPYPDESSHDAARAALALAKQARAGDLILTAFTGGSSALMCCAAEGITHREKRQVHEMLLSSGAGIREINAVRKHLSQIKGGLLAQAALPAELVNLTVSDVIGDPLDYICDLVVPDTSTVADAVDVLQRYDLWEVVAASVRSHLEKGADVETPKQLDPAKVHTFVVVPLEAAANAAAQRADELGFPPLFLTTSLAGESCEVGACLASIVREIRRTGRPRSFPCALIACGENTVTVPKGAGTGGPSQELALSLALHLDGLPGVVAVALDTDGTDGPTPFAGGMVDGQTASSARARALDVFRSLRAHDTSPLLRQLDDLVVTGATGTNVADLLVIIVASG